MAHRAPEPAELLGWWHGHEPSVEASAANAFGLSIDALRLLPGLKAIGSLLSEQEAAAWAAVGLTTAQGWGAQRARAHRTLPPAPHREAADGDPLQCEPGLRKARSEEHKSELQSLMRISYAVFCLKKKKT